MMRQILKILQGIGGLAMLLISITWATKGDYPHATYDLFLGVMLMYWSDKP